MSDWIEGMHRRQAKARVLRKPAFKKSCEGQRTVVVLRQGLMQATLTLRLLHSSSSFWLHLLRAGVTGTWLQSFLLADSVKSELPDLDTSCSYFSWWDGF